MNILSFKAIILKYIFFYLLLISYYKFIKFKPLYHQLKVCLCTPVKKENLYLNEFVEHYKYYKVDKIFLYDNNDIDEEHLEFVVNNYVQSGYIEIINYRGQKRALFDMMNDCYKKNYQKYDWLIFYEVDEYIHLKNYNNIKKFLIQEKFNKCETIQLNWVFHTDNEKLYYENKQLKKRFSNVARFVTYTAIKSILRGKIPNIIINCVHQINENLKSCNGFGNFTVTKTIGTSSLDYEYYYIDHYFCKSTEEFVKKMNKGDVLYSIDNIKERIKVYFAVNKPTKAKIKYLKQNILTNVSLDDIIPT